MSEIPANSKIRFFSRTRPWNRSGPGRHPRGSQDLPPYQRTALETIPGLGKVQNNFYMHFINTFYNAFFTCIFPMYFSHVFFTCIFHMYFSHVFFTCIFVMHFCNAFLPVHVYSSIGGTGHGTWDRDTGPPNGIRGSRTIPANTTLFLGSFWIHGSRTILGFWEFPSTFLQCIFSYRKMHWKIHGKI